MAIYFLTFILALSITVLFVPTVRRIAFRVDAIDKPDERKIHIHSTPRLGGVAIAAGFFIAVLFGLVTAYLTSRNIDYFNLMGILLGAAIVLGIGIIDDLKSISAWKKLFWQSLAAFIAMYCGATITFVSNPFNGMILVGWWGLPVAFLWIIGITNAMNLMDGLDGLASGITVISAVTLFIVALRIHQPGVAILLMALAGASLGFLRYNFYPAKIFLGDSGSLLLGFILATASIMGVLKSTLVVALVIPLLILGVPIYDTLSAIARRLGSNKHVFAPDRKHLHHHLLAAGLTQREAVLTIYLACVCLSIVALAITIIGLNQAILVLGIMLIAVIVAVTKIKEEINSDDVA